MMGSSCVMEITFIEKVKDIGMGVLVGFNVKVKVTRKNSSMDQLFENDIC